MSKVEAESPFVQNYLTILQSVISRMAGNSSGCKTWCISLFSAIIVIVADKGKPNYVYISAVPIVLFFLLDAYYLALERQFRDVFDDFIGKLHSGKATLKDVFLIQPRAGLTTSSIRIIQAGCSIAVWPFYSLLAIMLVVVAAWII